MTLGKSQHAKSSESDDLWSDRDRDHARVRTYLPVLIERRARYLLPSEERSGRHA
ncbi:three-helix bundle dimerization domain-containing protein [Streptomyces erythrochromogenes]|uniref:three-helix bundle dimerization domain-containing protein n=1 Tax=Streptomyces erythrochromogenes TaxID=285574 RepID=UPI0036988881